MSVAPAGTQPTAVSTDISAVTAAVPAVFQPAAVSAAASAVPAAASTDISVVTAAVPVVFQPAAVPAAVQPRWQPPEHGRMKCNVDAAFFSQRNKTGVGICIRDEDGVFVLARTVTFIGVYPVDIGEALGNYHALQWASDMT